MHPRTPDPTDPPTPTRWRTLSGGAVRDLVLELQELLGEEARIVHVGTDSKPRSGRTDFVTVVAVVDPGRGGRVFYRRQRHRRAHALADRLFLETQFSLEVAVELARHLVQDIVVHVDANQDARHRSSRYVHALAGMVVGYGFQVLVKPDAWCATHVADFVVKEKHVRVA